MCLYNIIRFPLGQGWEQHKSVNMNIGIYRLLKKITLARSFLIPMTLLVMSLVMLTVPGIGFLPPPEQISNSIKRMVEYYHKQFQQNCTSGHLAWQVGLLQL